MSEEERYLFHAKLGELIVKAYAEERHAIADDDPKCEEKRAKNKHNCLQDLKKLNRYFFGAKQLWECANCPLMDYWALSEAEKMASMSGERK